MMQDQVTEIGIDEQERLYIIPASVKFPYIYREAMEVNWDEERGCLYSPKPKEWSYVKWYKQIISALHQQDCNLLISNKTTWINIPEQLKVEIINLRLEQPTCGANSPI